MTKTNCEETSAHTRAEKAAQQLFVAQIKPNGLAVAKAILGRQGFEIFMPMQGRTTRHARKVRNVWRPLFLDYIFVSFDPATTQWRVINNTIGVQTQVSANRIEPQRVPATMMLALLQGCDHTDRVLPSSELATGDKVRVLHRPFQDVLAEVQAATKLERVRLLFGLMGRVVIAECPRVNLEVLPT